MNFFAVSAYWPITSSARQQQEISWWAWTHAQYTVSMFNSADSWALKHWALSKISHLVQLQYWELGLAVLEMSGWGSNSRLLLMQHATLPLLFRGDLPPLMTFPKQGDHSAARESIQPDGISLSTPCHPAVLASQVAWKQERANSPATHKRFASTFYFLSRYCYSRFSKRSIALLVAIALYTVE